MNAQMRICQLPVANVLDSTKLLMIVTVTLLRRVLIAYKIVSDTSSIMFFVSRECSAMLKARGFVIRETGLDGERNDHKFN